MSRQKILLVEDNPVETLGITRLLQQRGFTVTPAQDAAEAIRAVRENPPDLVVLDINLPANSADSPMWDGLDFMDWIHLMASAHIPVILLTNTPLKEIQNRGKDVQTAVYFQKPADSEKLIAAIRSALDKSPAR